MPQVKLKFVQYPDVICIGARLFFRNGRTKGMGTVVDIVKIPSQILVSGKDTVKTPYLILGGGKGDTSTSSSGTNKLDHSTSSSGADKLDLCTEQMSCNINRDQELQLEDLK